jgi:hypothetical protein
MVSAVFKALQRHGVTADSLKVVSEKALAELSSPERRRASASVDSALLGSALTVWHRDPRFLGSDGLPKPLTKVGRKGSIAELARVVAGSTLAGALASRLLRGRLVRAVGNTGTYRPANRSARMRSLNKQQIDHIANGVNKLLQTTTQNYVTKTKDRKLFEQSASVAKLPVKYREPFRKFVNRQGAEFVASIDDWLEARAVRPGPAGVGRRPHTLQAGVYAFGFLG